MRSFPIVLGVMLVFSMAAPDALAEDDATLGRDTSAKGPSCSFNFRKMSELTKGMTYKEVLDLMGCEPAHVGTKTYENGTGAEVYGWSVGNLQISASFIDGGLFETTAIIADALPFDPYETQRAEFLRRWLNIHRQEMK